MSRQLLLQASGGPQVSPILFDGTVASGASEAIPVSEAERVQMTVDWPSGTTGGEVALEFARNQAWAGAWKELGSSMGGGGKADLVDYTQPTPGFVRANFKIAATGTGGAAGKPVVRLAAWGHY